MDKRTEDDFESIVSDSRDKKQSRKRQRDDRDDHRKKDKKHHYSRSHRHNSRPHQREKETSTGFDEKSDDDSSSYRKSRKRHKTKKERKRDYRYYSSSEDESYHSKNRRKRKKESHYKKKAKRKKSPSQNDNEKDDEVAALERNYVLADSLYDLLNWHPDFASDLPIMLIRLAGGTSFDLRQMTNASASRGLARVFAALTSFGVEQGPDGSWVWKAPVAQSGRRPANHDLVLLRVVRAMLEQIGLTGATIQDYENDQKESQTLSEKDPTANLIENAVQELLDTFDARKYELAQELTGLCSILLQGQVVMIDDLPDVNLRDGLKRIFELSGLQRSEMDNEEDSDHDQEENVEKEESLKIEGTAKTDTEGRIMGYGLPESSENHVTANIQAVLEVCKQIPKAVKAVSASARRPTHGPMLPSRDPGHDESSDDDVGPALLGAQKKFPALPPDIIRAQTEQRARELEFAKSGLDPATAQVKGSDGSAVREEWMLVPGKFDFLSAIKSGQTARSRTFETKSKVDVAPPSVAVDAAIKAEIDAIMDAHEEARGPSLMEIHRQKKAQESKEKEGDHKPSWKWNRDKDLDAGRRVDKDALNMILGSASTELRKKFQGGFH